MADELIREISFPKIPDNITDELKEYIRYLEITIRESIKGIAIVNPDSGILEYHDSRLYLKNLDHQRSIDRTSDVALETVTVENTTDETLLWTGHMGANSLVEGNIFKFHCDGVISNGGPTAADQIIIRIKVGGVTVASLEPRTKALSSDHWHIDANATQRTIGASGSRAVHIDLSIGDEEETVLAVAAIDTTASLDVTITAEWRSADEENVISLYQAYMEYKN